MQVDYYPTRDIFDPPDMREITHLGEIIVTARKNGELPSVKTQPKQLYEIMWKNGWEKEVIRLAIAAEDPVALHDYLVRVETKPLFDKWGEINHGTLPSQDYRSAATFLDKVMKEKNLTPDSPEGKSLTKDAGILYARAGEFDKAIARLKSIEMLDPITEAKLLRANVAISEANAVLTREAWRNHDVAMLTKDPTQARMLFRKSGQLFLEAEDFTNAIEQFKFAHDELGLASIYLRGGTQKAEGIRILRRLKRYDLLAKYFGERGDLKRAYLYAIKSNKIDDAALHLEHLTLDPNLQDDGLVTNTNTTENSQSHLEKLAPKTNPPNSGLATGSKKPEDSAIHLEELAPKTNPQNRGPKKRLPTSDRKRRERLETLLNLYANIGWDDRVADIKARLGFYKDAQTRWSIAAQSHRNSQDFTGEAHALRKSNDAIYGQILQSQPVGTEIRTLRQSRANNRKAARDIYNRYERATINSGQPETVQQKDGTRVLRIPSDVKLIFTPMDNNALRREGQIRDAYSRLARALNVTQVPFAKMGIIDSPATPQRSMGPQKTYTMGLFVAEIPDVTPLGPYEHINIQAPDVLLLDYIFGYIRTHEEFVRTTDGTVYLSPDTNIPLPPTINSHISRLEDIPNISPEVSEGIRRFVEVSDMIENAQNNPAGAEINAQLNGFDSANAYIKWLKGIEADKSSIMSKLSGYISADVFLQRLGEVYRHSIEIRIAETNRSTQGN